MFRARVITFLVDKGLLPPERAKMLRGWVHSGFNVYRSRRVLPDEREDLERLAQYIIRNPFAVESRAEGETGCPQGSNGAKRSGNMQVGAPNRANPDGSIIIDVSEHQPRRIPSAKWRELIKKVWEADPLMCPKCQKEMRIVSLINERDVIERILRHLGLWEQGVRVLPARAPPEVAEWVIRAMLR